MSLNAICPYYTMFPVEFPLSVLDGLPPESWVLDPFCGRGTTLFAARKLGLPSVGFDVNPVATAIAAVKLITVTPDEIVTLAKTILKRRTQDEHPDGEFWLHAFHPKTFRDILKLRRGLAGRNDPAAIALRAIVLGCLHGPQLKTKDSYLSNQMPRTFASKPGYSVKFWQERGIEARKVDTLALIAEKAQRFFSELDETPGGQVFETDAREIPELEHRVAATVTSPPYFGMTTYVQDQWLRNWFLGGPPNLDYRHQSQICKGTKQEFMVELGRVWRRVAEVSTPGAILAIRFGALCATPAIPEDIVRGSLAASGVPWVVEDVRNAGAAIGNKRQANQMGSNASSKNAIEEVDVICRLH